MSPVDSYRVILIDAQSDTASSSNDSIMFGAYAIIITLIATFALLGIGLKDLRSRNN